MAFSCADIAAYKFTAAEPLLLDANVWLRIYGPTRPGDRNVAVYSSAYGRMLLAKAVIVFDVLVASEFVNAWARLEHNLAKSDQSVPRDFKAFRQSPHFSPIAADIASNLKRILASCVRVGCGFELLDINTLVSEFEAGRSDFNDLVLAELCKARGAKLVTHDADFKGKDLTVITANKQLLS